MPLLGFIRANYSKGFLGFYIEPSLLTLLFGSFICILLCVGILGRLKKLIHLAIILSGIWYLQFFYVDAISFITSYISNINLAKFIFIVMLFCIPIATALNNYMKKIFVIYLLLLACFCIFTIILKFNAKIDPAPPTNPISMQSSDNSIGKRNVYYIIMDGMTSEKSLIENGNFSNEIKSNFNELDKYGFYNAYKAMSSYNVTGYTLASIFHTEYFHKRVDRLSNSSLFPQILYKNAKNLELVKKLNSTGYSLIYIGNNWSDCNDSYKPILCLKDIELSNESKKSSTINLASITSFFNQSLIGSFLYRLKIEDYFFINNDGIQKIIYAFSSSSRVKIENQSRFFFIHQLNPHPPFTTKDCKYISHSDTEWNKEGYASSVTCSSKRMVEFAKFINEKDPAAIVIFQGDHGPAYSYKFWPNDARNTKKEIIEHFAVYNSIKFPNACKQYLFPSLDNVGTINATLYCISNGNFGYVNKPSLIEHYDGGSYDSFLPLTKIDPLKDKR